MGKIVKNQDQQQQQQQEEEKDRQKVVFTKLKHIK